MHCQTTSVRHQFRLTQLALVILSTALLTLGGCTPSLEDADVAEGGTEEELGQQGSALSSAHNSNDLTDNVALYKPTSQSSTGFGGTSDRAVDGNVDGVYANNSVTHTNTTTGSWWEVDLGAAYLVRTINVYNRSDCCSERLNGAVIKLLNAKREVVDQQTLGQGRLEQWKLPQLLVGRYVRIEQPNNYLSLADVQVFAIPRALTNVALSKVATQSTLRAPGNEASIAVDGYIEGNWSVRPLTHTREDDSSSWWELDLGSAQTLKYLFLYNRTDCCGDRLLNAKVTLLGPDRSVVDTATIGDLKRVYFFQLTTRQSVRYVRVARTTPGPLSLAEVEAYTDPGAFPSTSLPTTVPQPEPVKDGSGTTPGNFSVSAGGAASYEIPIVVPPGTLGMQPGVSLRYDSGQGNGTVGMGFAVSGLSSIGRCPKTYAQDGAVTYLRYDETDPLCLDGQRLVAVSGTYGRAGAVYRTERESWVKVVQLGDGVGSTFTVYTRDGTMREYGEGDAGLRLDNSKMRGWALKRVVDRFGNEMQYDYSRNDKLGEYLPVRIAYGANRNTGAPHRRELHFEYETRQDGYSYYASGGGFGVFKRLSHVRTAVDGMLVRDYRLSYDYSPTTRRSRLTQVQECDATGHCLQPTVIGWSQGRLSFTQSRSLPFNMFISQADAAITKVEGIVQDWNGDGVLDFSRASDYLSQWGNTSHQTQIYWGGATGFTQAGELPSALFQNLPGAWVYTPEGISMDINGDGIADVAKGNCPANQDCSGGYSVFHGSRSGVFAYAGYSLPGSLFVSGNHNASSNAWKTRRDGVLMDMTGDGIADYTHGTCSTSGSCDLRVYRGTGTGFVDAGFNLPGSLILTDGMFGDAFASRPDGLLMDFNGDGIADYSRATCYDNNTCNLIVQRGTGTGFETGTVTFSLPGAIFRNQWNGFGTQAVGTFADFNGDGLPDYVGGTTWSNGATDLRVFHNTGAGFVYAGYSVPGRIFYNEVNAFRYKTEAVLEDFTGDGKADWVSATCVGTGNCQQRIFASTGNGFYDTGVDLPVPLYWSEPNGWGSRFEGVIADLTGDGGTDISRATCWGSQSNCDLRIFEQDLEQQDRAVSIDDGQGRVVSITYKPLTDTSVYSQTARNPSLPASVIDVRRPVQVVASYTVTNGAIATYAYQMKYESARADTRGRGFLGFESVSITDVSAGLTTRTSYAQVFPRTGLVTEQALYAGSELLARETRNYQDVTTGSIREPRLSSSTVQFFAPDQTVYRTVQKLIDAYDAYGNPTQVQELATGTPTLVRCLSYLNDTTAWQLGLLQEDRLTSSTSRCATSNYVAGSDLSWRKRTYDSRGAVTQDSQYDDVSGMWRQTSYGIDSYGNRTTQVDGAGTTDITYDAAYHTFAVKVMSPPNGAGVRIASESLVDPRFGLAVEEKEPSGLITTNTLDGLGRLVKQAARHTLPAAGQRTLAEVSYLAASSGSGERVCQPIDGGSLCRVVRRDPMGRPVQEELSTPSGRRTLIDRSYDVLGRLRSQSLPYFAGTTRQLVQHSYDHRGMLTDSWAPNGTHKRMGYAYGSTGIVRTTTEAEGSSAPRTTVERLDGHGRVFERVLANGGKASFVYDALQRVTRTTDPMQVITSVTFDSRGYEREVASPNEGITRYEHDAVGRISGRRTVSGSSITKSVLFQYDALGRMLRKTLVAPGSADEVTSFTYDQGGALGLGHLTSATDASGVSYQLSYDAYGNLATRSVTLDGATYVSATRRDAYGRVEREVYPDGYQLRYGYDTNGELGSLTMIDASGGNAKTYGAYSSYAASGAPQSATLGDGSTTTYAFNALTARLDRILAKRANGTSLLDRSYGYNAHGSVTSVSDALSTTGNRTFTYDAMGFLASVAGPFGTLQYSYDLAGSLTAKEGMSLSYRPQSHLLTSTDAGDAFTYSSDGLRTLHTKGTEREEYTWDAEDHLRKVVYGTGTSRFGYDPLGQRIRKQDANGDVTLYVTANYEVLKRNNGETYHTKYIDGPTGRIAQVTRAGQQVTLITTAEAFPTGLSRTRAEWLERMHDALDHGADVLNTRAVVVAMLTISLLASLALLLFGGHGGTRMGRLRARLLRRHAQRDWAQRLVRGNQLTRLARLRPLLAALVPVFASIFLVTSTAQAALTPGGNGAGRPLVGTRYFHHDVVGNTAVVTDETGATLSQIEYRPFGAVESSASTGVEDFRASFAGKERDQGTNLSYFGARYYDSAFGQFLGRDPARQFFSPFTYANNDPASAVDPDGRLAGIIIAIIIAIGFAIGAYMGGVSANGSFNPAEWDWNSGKTWGSIFLGGALGALSAGAGLVIGPAVGAMGLSAAAAKTTALVVGMLVEGLLSAAGNAFIGLVNGQDEDELRSSTGWAFLTGFLTAGLSGAASLGLEALGQASSKLATLGTRVQNWWGSFTASARPWAQKGLAVAGKVVPKFGEVAFSMATEGLAAGIGETTVGAIAAAAGNEDYDSKQAFWLAFGFGTIGGISGNLGSHIEVDLDSRFSALFRAQSGSSNGGGAGQTSSAAQTALLSSASPPAAAPSLVLAGAGP